MGFITKIMRAVDVLMEDESVEKGNNFEKYVVNLFDERYFSLPIGARTLRENTIDLLSRMRS